VFLCTALISLYFSKSPITPVPIITIAYYLLPYIFVSQALILLQARSLSAISGMVIGYISFPTLVWSTFEAIINRKMRFKVTPKSASIQGDIKAIFPQVIVVAICIGVICHALIRHSALTNTDYIPMFWVTYALCMLLPTFVLAKFRSSAE
jgi:hypothetical protein